MIPLHASLPMSEIAARLQAGSYEKLRDRYPWIDIKRTVPIVGLGDYERREHWHKIRREEERGDYKGEF